MKSSFSVAKNCSMSQKVPPPTFYGTQRFIVVAASYLSYQQIQLIRHPFIL